MKLISAHLTFALGVCVQTFPARAADDPVPEKVPQSIASRVYFQDTGSYDPLNAIGKIGTVDIDTNTVTTFIDKAHFACNPDEALKAKVNSLPGAKAFYFLLENGYHGSLSILTASADLKSDQKMEITIDDVSSVDLTNACQLGNQTLFALARRMPSASGKRVFYVTGVTMSHLTKQIYSKQEGKAELSAGSWLSAGGGFYKGNNQIDSVPVTSVRGYYVDVPRSGVGLAAFDDGTASAKPFASAADLGISPDDVKLVRAESDVD